MYAIIAQISISVKVQPKDVEREMRFILIFWTAAMLIGCGFNTIPYSDNTNVVQPNAAAVSHYDWGLTYAKKGNLAQAIIELRMAIQNEPGWTLPYFNLGAVYGNMGELDEAILAWERATQLDPNFAKAHFNLAVAYATRAEDTDSDYAKHMDIERSIASLQEAIQVDKEILTAVKTEPAFDRIRELPEFKALDETTEPK